MQKVYNTKKKLFNTTKYKKRQRCLIFLCICLCIKNKIKEHMCVKLFLGLKTT